MQSSQYREIRKMVWEKATHIDDVGLYKNNKKLLKDNVEKLCKQSDISNYLGNDEEIKQKIWDHLWKKIRYSGFKANTASKEIKDILEVFSKYDDFTKKEWEIEIAWDKEKRKHVLVSGGKYVHDFLNKKGIFLNKQAVGNLVKLKKTIVLARKYSKFVKDNKPLLFITSNYDIDDVWAIHQNLQNIGYTADLTALHLMMDLGFKVIKPDVVISKLFLSLGWLHDIIPDLPEDITSDDLVGKGKYKSKFHYRKPKIYKPIINLASEVVKNTDNVNLKDDIGWATGTPIREFDIFMVKFGQVPEAEWGLTKNLSKEKNLLKELKTSASTLSI